MSSKSKKSENSNKKRKDRRVANASPVVQRVRVEDIVIKGDFRKLDDDTVSELAASLKEVGLLNPPTVYIKKPDQADEDSGEVRLVAGQHRVEAAKKLGWEYIDVIVVTRGKKTNRKRQITENLHRKDLSKLDRGLLIKEWVALCAREGGQVAHPQPHDKGISRAAKSLGLSKKTVRRGLEVGSLHPAAQQALREAGLDDNEQVMLEVQKAEAEDQAARVQGIVRERAAKAKGAGRSNVTRLKPADDDWEDDWGGTPFERLKKAWGEARSLHNAWLHADAADRQRFIDEILLGGDDADDDGDDWGDAA